MSAMIKKALATIYLKHPFFASWLTKLPIEEVDIPSVDTFATDGKRIMYNRKYAESLDRNDTIFVLLHEVLHIMFLHHTRRHARKPKLWNIACDYAINRVLYDMDFKIRQNILLDNKYKDMSAEQIYEQLKKEGKEDMEMPQGYDIGSFEEPKNEQERLEAESKSKENLAEATVFAKNTSSMPSGLERYVKDLLKPKVNWRDHIVRFVSDYSKYDYTWKMPNPRYLSSGLYLPSFDQDKTLVVAVAIDTSGSVNEGEIRLYLSEIAGLFMTFSSIECHVIACDSRVAYTAELDEFDIKQIKFKGGGGTSFIPPFEWLEEKDIQPNCLIYFTDGWCSSFADRPEYPVLWLISSEYNFQPPYGEVIKLV